MKKILISVEGYTEEQFITRILQPNFQHCYLQPVILTTRRDRSGKTHKGGIVSYAKIEQEIRRLLNDTSAAAVTTMYDYYGLPNDFPGKASLKPGLHASQKVSHLEDAFAQSIGDPRFIPYLSLHEFEALLLSDLALIQTYLSSKSVSGAQHLQRLAFLPPEEVNEGNPPSYHLKTVWDSYQKVADGISLAEQIGIHTMLGKCLHFKEWVDKLQRIC